MTDTPFNERTLAITASEMPGAKPWDSATGEALLDLLDGGPWGRFNQMRASVEDEWERYDKVSATKLFAKERSVGVRREGEPVFIGSVHCGLNGNHVRVMMQADDYKRGGAATAETWLARTLQAMPSPAEGQVNADNDQMMFRRTRKLPVLVSPLSELSWLHVVYPPAYEENYDRATLLAAPWYRIEERGDAIWMWSYEEPFQYDTPAARDSHAALRAYLGERIKP